MAFDYDLVILGGSMAARYAAMQASGLRARVALVEPDTTQKADMPLLQHAAFCQLTKILEQLGRAATWGVCQPPIAPPDFHAVDFSPDRFGATLHNPISWEKALEWVQETTESIAANEIVGYSLSQLAAAGVDVILGQGVFRTTSKKRGRSISPRSEIARPDISRSDISRSDAAGLETTKLANHRPVVVANGRYLRSRNYLLAPVTQSVIPAIEGLTHTNYRTIDAFWQKPWQSLPQRLTILGSDPRGLELAQLFNRLGSQVTLIVSGTQLLPCEDPSIVALLQSQLEAEGIHVLTQTRVTQAKRLGEQTWIQADDQALQTDALLLATRSRADLSALNLRSVGISEDAELAVNRRLQTVNPYIYACGDVLGGYSLAHLAEYEAEIALQNALFFPTRRVDYRSIPWATFTHPTLSRIGLTEPEAKNLYGKEVVIVQQSLQPLIKAQVQQTPVGLCKLVVRRNGEILGAHCLAPDAEEWISTIALAMQHRVKLGAIDASTVLTSSFSETLTYLIRQWQQHRWPRWRQNLQESWFNLRRS